VKILSIETSGKSFSVAFFDGKRVKSEVFISSGINHSEKLLPAIDKVLKKSSAKLKDIDRIAVSTGPGSFTGIRVALSCAKTFADQLDITVAAVDTLEVLKAGVKSAGAEVVPLIDALRGEVYRKGKNCGVEIVTIDRLLKDLKKIKGKIIIVGSVAKLYEPAFKRALGNRLILQNDRYNYPRASVLALMAVNLKAKNYKDVEPVYIRKSWAEEKRQQLSS